jgi:hypothetical protein
MATRQRSSQSLRNPAGKRQRSRGRTREPSEPAPDLPVPSHLLEAIEVERDNLSKAESLLACMAVSMEYQNDPLEGPYYPALAQLARELVERSINGLDPFMLRQRLLRNKIEEVFSACFADPRVLSSQASAT